MRLIVAALLACAVGMGFLWATLFDPPALLAFLTGAPLGVVAALLGVDWLGGGGSG